MKNSLLIKGNRKMLSHQSNVKAVRMKYTFSQEPFTAGGENFTRIIMKGLTVI